MTKPLHYGVTSEWLETMYSKKLGEIDYEYDKC